MRQKRIGLIVITILFALTVGGTQIYAQSAKPTPESDTPSLRAPATIPEAGINLTLSPTFITLTAEPGKSVTTSVKITNNNTFTEYLQIDIAKFEAAEDGTRPLITDMTQQDVHKDWVQFSEDQFTLAPSETKTIRVTIEPSEQASLGYYYAFIFNRMRELDSQEQGAVVSGAPAILTLLDVKSPDSVRDLQLIEFKTDKLFYEYLPAQLDVTVKNAGNIFVSPGGDVFIDSMRHKNIATIRANEGGANILPNTSRTYSVVWDDAFATLVPKKDESGAVVKNNNGDTVYETKYDFSKADRFRIGKYTANLIMIYDNGQRDVPIEASVSFWIIPYRMILSILAIIITPAVLVFLIMRWKYGKGRK